AWEGLENRPPRCRPPDAAVSGDFLRTPPPCRGPVSLPPVPRSLPLRAFCRLLRHELGVVAAVKEDHPVQLIAFQNGPAPTLRRVHLVVTVPGPFHGRFAVPCGRVAVHAPVD